MNSLLLLISLLLFSCNIKKFSLDEAKYFLEKNKLQLDSTSIQYLEQNSIKTVIRRSNSKVFNITTNSIEYSILCFNRESFNVIVDAWNHKDERKFWNKDFHTIVDDNQIGKNFYDFCKSNKIDNKFILNLLNFMGKFDIWMLSKSTSNNFVKYNIEPFEGLVYKDKNEFMNLDSNVKIEKITETWFYFKEPF